MAATEAQQPIDAAVNAVLSDFKGKFYLKKEQRLALEQFLSKKDVFALLPTGFGKSLIYQLAPLVAKRLELSSNPVVAVVSPLVALMEDQVREATNLGISAVQLGSGAEELIRRGEYQILFSSPESWLSRKWREMLATEVYRVNLIGIVVDEVHLTYKWGMAAKGQTAFRESFARLGELRSIVKPGTPVLALTASADLQSRAKVKKRLHLDSATIITVSPNRTNIRLGLRQVTTDSLDCLDWIVREVKEKGLNMSPLIIYCQTLKIVGRVFCHLKAELEEDAWVAGEQEHKGDNLIIGMFHSQTLPVNKSRVLSSLSGEGSCRVVVATTSLGLGVNFTKVSHVIMYGVPDDVEAMLQQVGRVGRDGTQAHAVVYATKLHPQTDEAVRRVIDQSRNGCFRQALYSNFENDTKSVEPGHHCCTYCHSVCKCNSASCAVPVPNYEDLQQISPPVQYRKVTSEDQELIRDFLQKYRESLVKEIAHWYTTATACTGFSTELIDSVVEHCSEIFDLKYIMNKLPVFKKQHAQEILRIIYEVFGDFKLGESAECHDDLLMTDMDFIGYFDEEDWEHDHMLSTCSSSESAFSLIKSSD